MTFAALKELGISCEFVVEQARLYIAEKRYQLPAGETLELNDVDQVLIMARQINVERIFDKVCDEETIIICDSSPLNSMLYMTENGRSQLAIDKKELTADLVFYCPPIERFYETDSNRVHDEDQSKLIDLQIPQVIKQYAPEVWNKLIPLDGDPKTRLGQVTSKILSRKLQ